MDIPMMVHSLVAKNLQAGGREIKCYDPSLQIAIDNLAVQIGNLQTQLAARTKEKEDLMAQMRQSQEDKQVTIANLTTDITNLNNQIQELQTAYQSLLSSKSDVGIDWKSLVPQATIDRVTQSYTNYPEAYIFYAGRYVNLDTKINVDMRVQNFVSEGMYSPEVRTIVSDCNGFVQNIMKEQNVSFHRACDIALMRVKHEISNHYYNYQYDSTKWKVSEFWQFPIETIKLAQNGVGSDCEDFSFLQYCAWRIAGIPEPFLRVVCGMTYSNEGHATTSYLSSDLKWRHCNSTSTLIEINDALQLPLMGTADPGGLGLKYVWFSFTENKSFHAFTSTDSKSAFDDISKITDEVLNHVWIRQRGR